MKKLKLLLPIIVSFFFFACSEDNSIYEPQQKENITIDKVENEDQDEEEELPEGQLVPGFHTVKLQVTQPDGQIVERRFKYYMPIAAYGNPSLIFEFHGSWEYQKKGAIPDPIKNIGVSDPLAQLAIQKIALSVILPGVWTNHPAIPLISTGGRAKTICLFSMRW